MTAYKCLRPGRVGAFSRFAWPVAAWVEAQPHVCASGIHACRAADIPYWLDAELWEIELEGEVPAERKLVARRGRLVRRVEAWDDRAARAFAAACAEATAALERVPEHAADAALYAAGGHAATAAFVAARSAELVGGPQAYAAERARQAAWLAEQLGLAG